MRSTLIALVSVLSVGAGYARTWVFTCDYYNLTVRGMLTGRQRVSARYTTGLAEGKVRWSDVTVAQGKDWTDTFDPAEKREFMDGFSYPLANVKNMTQPEFFHGFPPMAMQERNLVWDTHMLEGFAALYPGQLVLNTPNHVGSGSVALAGAGSFDNRDVQVTLVGTSERSGVKCALLEYTAALNKLDVSAPGLTLTGRSTYWGQIWVSQSTGQIEYATLFEDVVGELRLDGQQPQIINVFRKGVFAPAGIN